MDSPPECMLALSCEPPLSPPSMPSLDHSPQFLPQSPQSTPSSPQTELYAPVSPCPLPEASLQDEEEEEEEDEEKAEEETGEHQEEESSVSDSTPKAGKKSTQEVNKEMDEKIAKLKHFLDRAKSKHFSAIRIPKGLSERVFTETVAKQNAAKNQQQKAVKQGKRRTAVEDEPAQPAKLTSKEKRRIERAQKVKKVGVRYYETHNVKNKNKNRKIPSDGKKANRAKR